MTSYNQIKSNIKNIQRCVSFKLIEQVIVYNKGEFLNEYTRFYGNEEYVIYNDGNIITTSDENKATVFFSDDKAQSVYLSIIEKIKSKELKYDGILVIEYNELHNRSSEVLHYPNHHYVDLIQPISIYKGNSNTKEKAIKRRNTRLKENLYEDFLNYVNSKGWQLTDDDLYYINLLDNDGLQHLLNINRCKNNFINPISKYQYLKNKKK